MQIAARAPTLLMIALFPLLALTTQPTEEPTAKYPFDTPIGETSSIYTPLLIKLAKSWPPKGIEYVGAEGRALHIQVFSTPDNEDYIGIQQGMQVQAPVTAVEAVLDDVSHYKDLFPGFEDIHKISGDGIKFDVFWENIIPVFFIANLKYVTTYLVDKSNPKRPVYRSQLKEKKGLKTSDMLIVLEPQGSVTRYAEYDFWDADYGLLKGLAAGKIWKDSVEAVIISDLTLKMKAEKPTMGYADIMDAGKKEAERYPLEALVKAKKPFYLLEEIRHLSSKPAEAH